MADLTGTNQGSIILKATRLESDTIAEPEAWNPTFQTLLDNFAYTDDKLNEIAADLEQDAFRFMRRIRFPSGTSVFRKADYPSLRAIGFHLMGGGGGGGGANGATYAAVGGGGAGGQYIYVFRSSLDLLPDEAEIIVGAGGAPGTASTSGGNGGDTLLEHIAGSYWTVPGGKGGSSGSGSDAPPKATNGGFASGAASVPSDSERAFGQPGQPGVLVSNDLHIQALGGWGGGPFGGGPQGTYVNPVSGVNGIGANGVGGGGNGAVTGPNSTANGGSGSAGEVLLDLYA